MNKQYPDGIEPRHLSRFLNRHTPPHIITLVLLAGMGALNMNLILPSLPAMTSYFQTDYAIMQLAISGYLGMTALLQLIVGPLSDRYGRRPVIIAGLSVFILASLATAFAENIETFMFARMVQATIVTGFALSRAIVRDMFRMEQAASMIGYVTMGMTLIPMIGPAIGGFLQEHIGWQANFYLTAIAGTLTLLIVIFDLQETNHFKSESMTEQFQVYPELIGSRRFWGFTFSALFASGTFFAFIGGAPYVAENHLNMKPSELGIYFICIATGYMIGNFLSGRFTERFGIFTMMNSGALFSITGVAISLIYFYAGYAHPFGFFAPLLLVGMGNGLTLPSAMAGIVSVRPHIAGSASGLGGAVQIGGGAMLSVLAGVLLSPESGPFPLLWLMMAAGLAGLGCTLYTRSVARQMEMDSSEPESAS